MDDPNGPQNLEKLSGMLKGMVRQARRAGRRRNSVKVTHYVKSPRQVCDICLKLFDEAVVADDAEPELSRCVECKEKLAKGWTVLLAFGASPLWIESKMVEARGKLYKLTQEQYDAVKRAGEQTVDRN